MPFDSTSLPLVICMQANGNRHYIWKKSEIFKKLAKQLIDYQKIKLLIYFSEITFY